MGLDQQTYEGPETSRRHTCVFQHSPSSVASTSENVVRLSHLIESAFWTSLYQSNDDQSTTSGLDHQYRCLRKSQALLDKLQTYNLHIRCLNNGLLLTWSQEVAIHTPKQPPAADVSPSKLDPATSAPQHRPLAAQQ
jgi:hypothetical protein